MVRPNCGPARPRPPAKALGLTWRKNLGLPNRSVEATLEARRRLAGVLRTVRPRYVFAPYWDDSHPDHIAASRLCEDARFWAKLSRSDLAGEPFWPPRMFYYWSVHLRIHPKPAFVLDISDAIDAKMQALAAYQSQFVDRPAHHLPDRSRRHPRPGPLLGLDDRQGLRRTLRQPRRDRHQERGGHHLSVGRFWRQRLEPLVAPDHGSCRKRFSASSRAFVITLASVTSAPCWRLLSSAASMKA